MSVVIYIGITLVLEMELFVDKEEIGFWLDWICVHHTKMIFYSSVHDFAAIDFASVPHWDRFALSLFARLGEQFRIRDPKRMLLLVLHIFH